jgi:hypothetical protein
MQPKTGLNINIKPHAGRTAKIMITTMSKVWLVRKNFSPRSHGTQALTATTLNKQGKNS